MWTFYGEVPGPRSRPFVMLIVVGHQETPPATEQSGPFSKPFGIKDGHSILKEWFRIGSWSWMMNIKLDVRGPMVGKSDSAETPVARAIVCVEWG